MYLCTVGWRGGRLAWKIYDSHKEGEDGRYRQEKQVVLDLTSNLANLYWYPCSMASGRLVEIGHLECGCYAGVIWSRDVDMMCWGIFHHQAGNQEAHLKNYDCSSLNSVLSCILSSLSGMLTPWPTLLSIWDMEVAVTLSCLSCMESDVLDLCDQQP